MELKPFNCTIRIFDVVSGATLGEHVLPVNSPDAEHAAASTLANAAAFTTTKTSGGMVEKPLAFSCIKIEPRN